VKKEKIRKQYPEVKFVPRISWIVSRKKKRIYKSEDRRSRGV